jgi:hypothetical protein
MKLLLIASIIAGIGFAQDVPAPAMNPAEHAWQDSMTNVKMIGSFTVGDGKELHDDAYLIEKITKVADGQWSFVAHIQYGGRDVKVTLKVPVQFAGDTPVINFTRQTVPGMGTYNAKVLFFNGGYAGTWGAGDHGGSMFGKIVKNDMPEDTPVLPKKLPQ